MPCLTHLYFLLFPILLVIVSITQPCHPTEVSDSAQPGPGIAYAVYTLLPWHRLLLNEKAVHLPAVMFALIISPLKWHLLCCHFALSSSHIKLQIAIITFDNRYNYPQKKGRWFLIITRYVVFGGHKAPCGESGTRGYGLSLRAVTPERHYSFVYSRCCVVVGPIWSQLSFQPVGTRAPYTSS